MEKIIPKIVAILTRHDREIMQVGRDFEWSSKSWTHNFFRAVELVIGRRAGGRCENAIDLKTGKVYNFTSEAWINHHEGLVRQFFWKLAYVRLVIPMVQTPFGPLPVSFPYLLAAYDNSGSTLYGASPRTFSLSVSGSNRLMVFNPSSLTDSAGTQSYNSVSGTSINKTTYPGVGRTGTNLFYLNAPATGSNTVSCAAGSNLMGMAASYTGFNQTASVVDSSGVTSNASSATVTGTTTVVSTGCWLITGMSDSAGSGQPYTSGTGTVRVSSNDGACIFDSNATVSTGSQSINITHNSGWACVTASFLTESSVVVTPDLRSAFY